MIFFQRNMRILKTLKKHFIIILILCYIAYGYSISEETSFLDAKKMLRMHRFEEEVLQVSRYHGGFTGLTRASDLRFSEKKFDNMQRVEKEISWVKKESIELAKEISYTYFQEETIPQKKEEISYIDKQYIEVEYNAKNSPISETILMLTEDQTVPEKSSEEHFVSSISWVYDEKNRIIKESFRDSTGKQERKEYTYTKKADAPNMKIFENDFLIFMRVYESNENRKDSIYFEDGYSVQALYKDGRKVSEAFLFNDEIIRITEVQDTENTEKSAGGLLPQSQIVKPLEPAVPQRKDAPTVPTPATETPLPLIEEQNEYIFNE
ncbi:MAG: hypothetical protein ACRC4W_05575 [Treponemataceae bacterium]